MLIVLLVVNSSQFTIFAEVVVCFIHEHTVVNSSQFTIFAEL